MDSTDHVGIAIRYLIDNQKRRRPAEKKDLKKFLSVNIVKLDEIIEDIKTYLVHLRLELYIFKDDISSTNNLNNKTERFFIRKIVSVDDDKKEVTPDDERLYTLFAVLQAENNNLVKPEDILKKCNLFKSINISDWLKKTKMAGYIKSKMSDSEIIWSTGWRYEVDFSDFFNIFDYFKMIEIKK